MRWRVGLEIKPKKAFKFYATLGAATIAGLALNFIHLDQSIIHCRGYQWNSRGPSDGSNDVVDAKSKGDGPVYVATLFEGTEMGGSWGHVRRFRGLFSWSFSELSNSPSPGLP
jgi:hypothetical protein